MPQIKELGTEKLIPDNTDLLPVQQSDGATRRISRANFLAGVSATVPTISLTAGAIAEYRFDEVPGQQLTDYSGNNRHGILGISNANGTQDPTRTPWLDTGLNFITNQYISLPTYTWFAGNFFAEFVFLSRSQQSYSRLIDADTVTSTSFQGLVISPSYADNRPFVGFAGTNILTSEIANLNKFHHLAVQLNSTTVSIFLNNVLTGSGTLSIPSGSRPFTLIGKSNYAGGAYFDGIIAHMDVYNRVLTNTERVNNFLSIQNRLKAKGVFI